jgi:hypothetical protein
MIRLAIFLSGLLMLLAGANATYHYVDVPWDLRSIVWSIGLVTFSLDVVLVIAGVFLIVIAIVFHRLNTITD